jgi:protein TonB
VPPPPPINIAPVEHHEPPPPPAPPPPPHTPVVDNPDWLHKPNGDDYADYYPARAMELDKTGRVTLHCTVTAKGTLADCSADEDPPGYGFGDASLRISKLFKMKPLTADGKAVEGGKFSTVIVWKLAE